MWKSRSQWQRGPRRESTAARYMGLRVRIPPGAWQSVNCDRCVMSSTGICDRLISRPDESYRVCVCVCVSLSVIKGDNNLYVCNRWVNRGKDKVSKKTMRRAWSWSNLHQSLQCLQEMRQNTEGCSHGSLAPGREANMTLDPCG